MKAILLIAALTQTTLTLPANASETINEKNGMIILEGKNGAAVYNDITNQKDGIYRALIRTNGTPALFTSGDADIIYTLKEENGKILIDCAIAETRSNQSGISIRNSICEINKELTSDYAGIGYSFTDKWDDEVSSIDITPLTMRNIPIDIIKGVTEGVEIHETYSHISQLENSTPDTYLKIGDECHKIPYKKVFVNYSTTNQNQPIGISVLTNPEIYEFKKYTPKDLKSLRYTRCENK